MLQEIGIRLDLRSGVPRSHRPWCVGPISAGSRLVSALRPPMASWGGGTIYSYW